MSARCEAHEWSDEVTITVTRAEADTLRIGRVYTDMARTVAYRVVGKDARSDGDVDLRVKPAHVCTCKRHVPLDLPA